MSPEADLAPPRVAILLMAAGLSSRMAPRNKLLLRDASGRTMIGRTATACSASCADTVLVVTGHQSGEVERAVREAGMRPDVGFVHADGYKAGLSASLQAGLAALPDRAAAVLVCLGDMPFVTSSLIDTLIMACAPPGQARIVVPVWKGQRGNPVLWGRQFFPELRSLSGDIGARGLLVRHRTLVTEVAADAHVLVDIDTEEAFAQGLGAVA